MKKRIKQDSDYDSLCIYLEGWLSYASHANTHKLRYNVTNIIESNFEGGISSLHLDRLIKQAEGGEC